METCNTKWYEPSQLSSTEYRFFGIEYKRLETITLKKTVSQDSIVGALFHTPIAIIL
jgi:hypothetical protein